jgi:hypothetical protein
LTDDIDYRAAEGALDDVFRTAEYCDLGEWVCTQTHIEARTPRDLPVEMTVFQLWKVRDGKVAVCRLVTSKSEALEAAGRSE